MSNDKWSNITGKIAKMVTGFGAFVDHLYQLGEQQYLFACLALRDGAELDDAGLCSFGTAIMAQRRHVMLGEALGQDVRKNGCRVLYKLGSLPHPMIGYRDLLRAMSIKPIGTALGHARGLSSTVISALPEFIDELLPIALLQLLASVRHISLVDACISLCHALPEEHRVAAIRELASARTPEAIGSWFDRWMLCLDFPSPPFAGTKFLRPISNFSELRSDGYMMRHCIAD